MHRHSRQSLDIHTKRRRTGSSPVVSTPVPVATAQPFIPRDECSAEQPMASSSVDGGVPCAEFPFGQSSHSRFHATTNELLSVPSTLLPPPVTPSSAPAHASFSSGLPMYDVTNHGNEGSRVTPYWNAMAELRGTDDHGTATLHAAPLLPSPPPAQSLPALPYRPDPGGLHRSNDYDTSQALPGLDLAHTTGASIPMDIGNFSFPNITLPLSDSGATPNDMLHARHEDNRTQQRALNGPSAGDVNAAFEAASLPSISHLLSACDATSAVPGFTSSARNNEPGLIGHDLCFERDGGIPVADAGIAASQSLEAILFGTSCPESVVPSGNRNTCRTDDTIAPPDDGADLSDSSQQHHPAGSCGPGPGHSSQVRPTRLSIGQISPLRDALMDLKDQSPMVIALHSLIQTGRRGRTSATARFHLRQDILNFSGFNPANDRPDPCVLTALARRDLDFLGGLFGMKRSATRKAEIARHVINCLRAPLQWITPSTRSRLPAAGASSRNGSNRQHSAPSRPRPTGTASAAPQEPSGGHATHRPTLSSGHSTSTLNGSSTNLYSMLIAEMQGRTGVHSSGSGAGVRRGPESLEATEQSNRNARGRASSRATSEQQTGLHLGKQASQSHLLHVLAAYDFQTAENPFNEPRGPPLGTVPYVAFGAERLGRGNDPCLTFLTPSLPKGEDGVDFQIHLRCLGVDAEKLPSKWKQSWPFPAAARVNGHHVALNQAQRYTNGKLAGIDCATNIIQFLRKHKPQARDQNVVTLRRHSSTANPASGTFVLFAQCVAVHSVEKVAKRVLTHSNAYWKDHLARNRSKVHRNRGQSAKNLQSGSRSGDAVDETSGGESNDYFELARQGIVKFMNSDDLTSSSMRVSLRCPLMLTRIEIPVKGRKCSHIQCFDLNCFLNYARRSSKFLCPVCNKANAEPDELVGSPFIARALQMFSCDDIEIAADGTLSPVAEQPTGVCSDDEDEGDAGAQGMKVIAGTKQEAHGPQSAVVDLTCDDANAPGDNFDTGSSSANRGAHGVGHIAVSNEIADATRHSNPPLAELQRVIPPHAALSRGTSAVDNTLESLLDEFVPSDANIATSCDVIALDSD